MNEGDVRFDLGGVEADADAVAFIAVVTADPTPANVDVDAGEDVLAVRTDPLQGSPRASEDGCLRCGETHQLAKIKGCVRCLRCGWKADCNGW